VLASVGAASAPACDAQIGEPAVIGGPTANPSGGSGTLTGAGTGGGPDVPPLDCASRQAPVLHARLLTPSQYNNSVSDLVKIGGNPSKDFGGGTGGHLDDLSVERRANAAADVARQAALTLAQWAPCTSPPSSAATCAQQIIDLIAPRVYRHPLSAAERMELQTLFDAGIKEKDFAMGVEWLVAGLLQSPDFLYQLPKLEQGEQAGQLRPIGSYELASRLSYFIWDSMPDEPLYAAAAANELADSSLRAQLDRMVHDPRFLRGVTSFYTSWLKLGDFHELARDDAGFTTDVVNALQTSLLMSATQLYGATAHPNVASLFSGTTYWLNGALRTFYGLPGTGTAFTAAGLADQERRGILAHPGLLALLARPNQSNPISRGLYVRKAILCQDMPPPPAGVVIPQLPPIQPGLSTRDRLDQHAKAPLCASCHDMIDPPGFAFENFDQVGRQRSVDSGRAVDTSGTMTNAGDLAGPFANGGELLTRIAQSQDIKACFAQKYFEHAVSRTVADEDACSVDALKKSFTPSGDLVGLVVSIANTDSFRFRLSEGGP